MIVWFLVSDQVLGGTQDLYFVVKSCGLERVRSEIRKKKRGCYV